MGRNPLTMDPDRAWDEIRRQRGAQRDIRRCAACGRRSEGITPDGWPFGLDEGRWWRAKTKVFVCPTCAENKAPIREPR